MARYYWAWEDEVRLLELHKMGVASLGVLAKE
jgi:hypothetical protein